MTNGPTVELSLRIPQGRTDELVGILGMLGFEGFWEDGEQLRAYVSEEQWSDELREEVREAIVSYAGGHEMRVPSLDVEIIPPTNWNAEWEASIKPIQATDRIIIAPTWGVVNELPGQLVLRIDPKMSFGTGHHETTRLVLRLLEPIVVPGCTVLDVGTGTGVLAIAALRLGAASAEGIDVDEWSYENAIENARLNGVQDRLKIARIGIDDMPHAVYSIVMANIQSSIILPALPELKTRIAPSGSLLLSGLLKTERETVFGACMIAGLKVVKELTEAEWIALEVKV